MTEKRERSSRLSSMLSGSRLAESVGIRSSRTEVPSPIDAGADKMAGRYANRNASMIDVDKIIPDPNQPRKQFDEDELKELAESIKDHELLQPIRVRWSDEHGKWIIVSGERRYRASQLNNATEIAVVIDDKERSTGEVRIHQIVENIQRSGFRPVEEAKAFAEAMKLESISAAELSRRLKKGRSYVSQSLSLLNLTDEQQAAVDAGTLPVREAYKLARVERNGDDPSPARSGSVKTSKKRKRGIEVTLRSTNGGKVTVAFGKKVDNETIRTALLEVAGSLEKKRAA